MCWIFAYKWFSSNAHKILLNWLERLEYRGYDSAGIFVWNNDWESKLIKSVWRIVNLSEKIYNIIPNWQNIKYNYGIAHTRWATHGWVNESNSHPHNDSSENIFVIHNWIIENYKKLKLELIKKWYNFYSDTDSEVIVKLIENNRTWDLLTTIENTLPQLEWAYALVIVDKRNPEKMIWVKYGSPLVFSQNDKNEFFFSSDTQALVWNTEKVVYLDDWDLVYISWKEFFIKSQWKLTKKPLEKLNLKMLHAEKWDYEHFMLKEIYEQPNIIRRNFLGRINFDEKTMIADWFHKIDKYDIKKVIFIWCGTSYHSWLLWTYRIENLVWIDAKVEISNEFEYKNFKVDNKTLFVFISQSWETADTIECLKLVKSRWGLTFWIVNVVWSTISRMTDSWMFTRAWTEVWVASSKAFTAQITNILMLALYMWKRKWLDKWKINKILRCLKEIPIHMETILNNTENIEEVAKFMSKYKNFFYLWKHYQYPIACESSLKLKELSYLHSEAYPSGELKHWPLALIDDRIPTILLIPDDFLIEQNLSSLQEIKARWWNVIAISDIDVDTDYLIKINSTARELYPFLTVIIWQLLWYFVAKELWKDIDKPRNLAKSVTVK